MKRRSATSSEPPERVFFTDRNLGRHLVPQRLREAGLQVEIHDDHFAQDVADAVWLPEVAARGWVVLTADQNLRYNRLEREALLASGARVFVIVGRTTHQQKAEAVIRGRHRIERLLQSRRGGFIAKLYKDGRVTLWLAGH